ncbi:MAG: hypothetical protein WCD89_02995 [Anaerocolumna sp.]
MKFSKQQQKSLELIEEFGLFLEKSGYLPSAARVYALLMIWDKPELHFDEIQEILQLSKGATSKALNNLETLGRIKMFTKTGVRKKLYKVNTKPGQDSAENFLIYIKKMHLFLERIEAHKEAYDNHNLRFHEELAFFEMLIEMFNQVLNYDKKNTGK